jgi:hypothetical protein
MRLGAVSQLPVGGVVFCRVTIRRPLAQVFVTPMDFVSVTLPNLRPGTQ